MLRNKITSILIATGLFFIATSSIAQNSIKIISYNILEGMVKDSSEGKAVFSSWIRTQNPDIVALQETNKFTQQSLETLAHSFNHPYAVLLKQKGYPVALTSKWPIINVSKVTDNMHHGFIKAETNGYNILVTHLSLSPHNYKKRREEIAVVLETILSSPKKTKWVLLGDLNSYSPLDKELYRDGKLVARLSELAKQHSFHDNLIEKKYLDFEVQQKVLDAGLIDAFHLKPSNEKFFARIDYCYISKDLKTVVLKAYFIRDAFTKTHSDHVPFCVELKNN